MPGLSTKPILGFAAYSGTGKTTLLRALIPLLRERGIRVGVIKHAHHNLEIDTPGKDSYELRQAGADQMLVASRRMWALLVDTPGLDEPQIDELVRKLDLERIDLVLIEGFKLGRFPKIELHRPSLGKPLIFPNDGTVIAVASDAPVTVPDHLPLLDINDLPQITQFICEYLAGR